MKTIKFMLIAMILMAATACVSVVVVDDDPVDSLNNAARGHVCPCKSKPAAVPCPVSVVPKPEVKSK